MLFCKKWSVTLICLLVILTMLCGCVGVAQPPQDETIPPAVITEKDVTLPSWTENVGAMDALSMLKERVTTLPSDSFKDTGKWSEQKQSLLSTIDSLILATSKGDYTEASALMSDKVQGTLKQTLADDEIGKLMGLATITGQTIVNAGKTTVKTGSGRVAGSAGYMNSWAWKGIPYARPPVGELRWRAPQDPLPWEGVRHSTDRYDISAQAEHSKLWVPTGKVVGSEDCLYLNVWRPRTDEKGLPVYFWIHGGSNIFGTNKLYDGSFLASRSNMVVVSIQYRLGPMGWFNHPALKKGATAEESSGNFGTLDTVKALTWVRDNISAFGGDAGNITVVGESAGGHNTLNLVISPLGAGLFHKAIVESGGMQPISVEDGIKQANSTIENLLISDGTVKNGNEAASYREKMTDDEIARYLRGKGAAELVKAESGDKSAVNSHSAVMDGSVIPGAYLDVIASGRYNRVPIIIGCNEYELKPFEPLLGAVIPTSSGYKWSDLYKVLDGQLKLDEVLARPVDKELYEACGYYGSRNWKAKNVDPVARKLREKQDNVWAYFFRWGGVGSGPSPYDFIIGAGHATEIPFFFGWPYDTFGYAFTEQNRAGREALQKAVMTYVAQFVRSGDPDSGDGSLPRWEAWSNDPGGPKCIVLDGTFTEARISMMTEEVTAEDVHAAVEALPIQMKALVKLWAQ